MYTVFIKDWEKIRLAHIQPNGRSNQGEGHCECVGLQPNIYRLAIKFGWMKHNGFSLLSLKLGINPGYLIKKVFVFKVAFPIEIDLFPLGSSVLEPYFHLDETCVFKMAN